MNFQERFKGKTSTISKDGIEGVVLSSLNPVKKQMSVSYSNAQLPRVVSSTSLDNSPKRPSKTPLSSTHVVANSIALADLPTPTSFTPNQNPGHRYRLSEGQFDSMNPFLPQSRQSLTPSREGQNYTRQLAPLKQRDRMLARRSLNGIATKSANQSQLFSEPLPSDQSGMSFNPNNFYNQHSQVRASGRTASEIHSNPRVELKANRNHLHKKSFENLSQQIKQKHISQEVFKSLVRPEYPHMSNQHQDESPVNSSQKTWRLYDSLQQQKRHERSLSYNSNHFADHNQHHIGQESHTIREINKGDMHIQGDDRSLRNEQGVILSRIRQRTPSSVNGAMHGRKVYFKNNEEWSERRDVVTFSQLQESGRPSHINLGNLYQPKSPERPKKTTWGEPLEANFK